MAPGAAWPLLSLRLRQMPQPAVEDLTRRRQSQAPAPGSRSRGATGAQPDTTQAFRPVRPRAPRARSRALSEHGPARIPLNVADRVRKGWLLRAAARTAPDAAAQPCPGRARCLR